MNRQGPTDERAPICATPIQSRACWNAEKLRNAFQVREIEWRELDVEDVYERNERDFWRPNSPVFQHRDLGQKVRELAADIANECENGLGLLYVRIARRRANEAELKMLLWALSNMIGSVVTQNRRGEYMAEVVEKAPGSSAPGLKATRAYETSGHLAFHSDASDILGLACISQARQGGELSICSAQNCHNILLERHREHLSALYDGFWYHTSADSAQQPVFRSRVYCYANGVVLCRSYLRDYIELAHQHLGYALPSAQREALDVFQEVASDPAHCFAVKLQPGDLLFLSNNFLLHSRTAYKDLAHDAPRRLVRTWMNPAELRSFPDGFAPFRHGYGN